MTNQQPYVRPFTDFLREQSHGETLTELSDALRDVVARVTTTGKAGTLTYVVKVEPAPGGSDALIVTDTITMKLPDRTRAASLRFPDRDGNLIGNDPNQLAALQVDPLTGEVTTPEPT